MSQFEHDVYIQGALNYLEQIQFKNDKLNPQNFKGEWPVSMVLEDNFILLGKEKKKLFVYYFFVWFVFDF